MWGYALAYYAWLRGERRPAWARHLDRIERTRAKVIAWTVGRW
jgi:hypothetical protein